MALEKSKGARIGAKYPSPISREITVGNFRVTARDIAAWTSAVNQARNPYMPLRRLLYELYNDIKLDGHLTAVMEKRKIAITNQRIHWQPKEEDNSEQAEKVKELILDKPWFHDLISHVMDANPFGHSLIELIPGKDGLIECAELINRANVIPELGFLLYNFYNVPGFALNQQNEKPAMIDSKYGIYYRDDPYSNYLIEVGGPKDYGKLMIAAQYVIYKRGGFGDWADFAELFGMPFRDAEYDPYDENARKLLEKAMSEQAGAAYIVRPKGTSINYHDANGTGKSEVYEHFIEMCNKELSKIFLGQTMTTEDGSSKSQASVHKEVEEDINVSDMLKLEFLLNGQIKEKLINNGYGNAAPGFADGRFIFPETSTIPLTERINIDKMLAVDIGLPMSERYFQDTYGVDKLEAGEVPVRIVRPVSFNPASDNNNDNGNTNDNSTDESGNEPNGNGGASDNGKKKAAAEKKKLSKNAMLNLSAFYHHALHHVKLAANPGEGKNARQSIWDRLAKEIHEGKVVDGNIDPELFKWTRDQLLRAVTKGFDEGIKAGDTHSEADTNMLQSLEDNVHVFSGFKTFDQLREATSLLTDEEGNIRSFEQFRNDILDLDEQYNVNYLNAEYNTAVASSQMAGRWVDIEKNKETLPMLTFRTSGGDNVCPECGPYDGLTAPVDSPIWDTALPPLHFGCVCDVDQSDDAVESNLEERDLPDPQPMFANNVGKSGVIFPKSHPYFDVSKADKSKVTAFLKHHPLDSKGEQA